MVENWKSLENKEHGFEKKVIRKSVKIQTNLEETCFDLELKIVWSDKRNYEDH